MPRKPDTPCTMIGCKHNHAEPPKPDLRINKPETPRQQKRRLMHESGLIAGNKARDRQSNRQFSCFWTWPWGHKFHNNGSNYCCVNCGKEMEQAY